MAGRPAYELVLAPKDAASLIGQVRLAIDAEEHIPLRVDVYAKNANDPAVRVAFQQISFTVPDAEQFVFNPPPGTKVTTSTPEQIEKHADDKATAEQKRAAEKATPTVVGEGWTSVLVAKMPSGESADAADSAVAGVLGSLPKVSGSWGSGRLLSGSLFSALLTDDGRVLVGAVAPEKLYEVAAR